MEHEHEGFLVESCVPDTVANGETIAHYRDRIFPLKDKVLLEYASVSYEAFHPDYRILRYPVRECTNLLSRSVGNGSVKSEVLSVNSARRTNVPETAGCKKTHEKTVEKVKTDSAEIFRSDYSAFRKV